MLQPFVMVMELAAALLPALDLARLCGTRRRHHKHATGLAHVAMDEGVVAAECIAGGASAMEYDAIPAVVFTHPELASVGLKEDEAELRGHKLKVGRFPFRGNGRARARDDMEGWVKVIADADTDVILGVHCIGPEAGHLIHEAVVAMGYGGYSEDLALTVHAHPTLSEAFKEAALAVDGRPLHI